MELLSKWILLTGCRKELMTVFGELFKIIPFKFFSMFSTGVRCPKELETLFCGFNHVDIDEWRRNTLYEGYSKNHEMIHWFWEIISSQSSLKQVKWFNLLFCVEDPLSISYESLDPLFMISNSKNDSLT
jgi:hypothetical protein